MARPRQPNNIGANPTRSVKMDDHTIEEYERCYAELAQFCFGKLANLEARFVILCHRAEALGIETGDIMGGKAVAPKAPPSIRVVN